LIGPVFEVTGCDLLHELLATFGEMNLILKAVLRRKTRFCAGVEQSEEMLPVVAESAPPRSRVCSPYH